MLQEMKQQLGENMRKARESGELTAHQVYDITHDGAAQTAQKLKGGAKDLREITKEAVTTTVQALVDAGEASQEKISAALHGAVDGVKQTESQMLNTARKELNQAKRRLQEEETKLAEGLNEAFEGAKEASGNFTEDVKSDIETALTDTKLKSTELLGLTRDTVKEAVHKAIEIGTEVDQTIINVTRDATSKALAEARFTAERARRISDTVLSAAVEAAEELGGDASETASAAAEGVRQGLTDTVEFTRESIAKARQGVIEFAAEDLEQTKEDLEAVGDLFVETLRKVADKSDNAARDILHELADDAKMPGSNLREKSLVSSHTVTERLKELGTETFHKTGEVSSKAAHTLTQETKELAERMLAVAKGAATGLWEGAMTVFHKDDSDTRR